MKGHSLWSYAPYKPLLHNIGDIYICRLAPNENTIHVEWLDSTEETYAVYCRKRDASEFLLCGTTRSEEHTSELQSR